MPFHRFTSLDGSTCTCMQRATSSFQAVWGVVNNLILLKNYKGGGTCVLRLAIWYGTFKRQWHVWVKVKSVILHTDAANIKS